MVSKHDHVQQAGLEPTCKLESLVLVNVDGTPSNIFVAPQPKPCSLYRHLPFYEASWMSARSCTTGTHKLATQKEQALRSTHELLCIHEHAFLGIQKPIFFAINWLLVCMLILAFPCRRASTLVINFYALPSLLQGLHERYSRTIARTDDNKFVHNKKTHLLRIHVIYYEVA